jgi:hypothetical protein
VSRSRNEWRFFLRAAARLDSDADHCPSRCTSGGGPDNTIHANVVGEPADGSDGKDAVDRMEREDDRDNDADIAGRRRGRP